MSYSAIVIVLTLTSLGSLLLGPLGPLLRTVALGLIALVGAYYYFNRHQSSKLLYALIASILPIITSLFMQNKPNYYETLLTLIFSIIFVFYLDIKWRPQSLRIVHLALVTIIAISTVSYVTIHNPLFGNLNALGIISATAILYSFFTMRIGAISKSVFTASSVISFAGVVTSGSRSPIIAIVASSIVILFLKKLDKVLNLKPMVMYTATTSIIAIIYYLNVYIYLYLPKSLLGEQANLFSRKYFGKNLFSGRQDRWEDAIQIVQTHSIWGTGKDIWVDQYSPQLSFHNLGLQYLVQFGLFGIIFLLLFTIFMFRGVNAKHNNYSFFMILFSLFVQMYEVLFFQNNIAVGLLLLLCIVTLNTSAKHKGGTSENLPNSQS